MDLRRNKDGYMVRDAKPRETVPAVVRFERRVVELACDGHTSPCLIWQGAPFLRINERTVRRPWRFWFEMERQQLTPNGANWRWLCDNENLCCEPSHLQLIGTYCKAGVVSDWKD